MNLNEHAQKIFSTIDIEKMFKDEIESKIQETVRETVKNNLRSYSKFGEELDKYFKDNVKLKVKDLPMTEYSNFITEQVCDVVKSEMNEERALKIRNKIKDKLGIYNVQEIELDLLMSKITDTLQETLATEWDENGGCFCGEPPSYRLVCRIKETKYTYTPNEKQYEIVLFEGEKENESAFGSNVIANLFLSVDGKAYHTSTKTNNDGISKIFNYYAYNGTLITGLDEYNEHITYEQY